MATNLQSWDHYLDAMRPAGELIKRAWRPEDPSYRADLYRQLVMNISYAYFQYFQSDARHPDFMPLWNSVFMLQPNPDDTYLYAPLQGDLRYRITGERGTIHLVNVQFGAEMIGMSDHPLPAHDIFDLGELGIAKGERFELLLSAERPAGHDGYWRRLDPVTDYMIIRQRSYDWGTEVDSRFAIECLDAPESKRKLGPDEVADLLDKLVRLPERWSAWWIDWQNRLLDTLGTNRFEMNDTFSSMSGMSNQHYWQAIYDIEPGDALIIETDLPEQRQYWNVQVNDPFFNAIEFIYRQSSINGHTAHVDSDGRFRAVVSEVDPGVPNWLDTAGFRQGTIIGRWLECSSAPLPVLTRVRQSNVRAHLPADTPGVTPDQRARALRERRLGAQLRRRW